MANFYTIYMALLRIVLKLAGFRQHRVEIEPGTIINIWGPNPAKNGSNRTGPKENKPAVVFLHGFAAEGTFTWQFQALALAREYSVYVPDLVFFGGSVTARPERSTGFQARCVAEALGRVGVRRCTVVGLSYGGMVGFKMAEMFPEMVEGLVASSTVMALTGSVSSESLRRVGSEKWSDFLLPETVEGVVKMLDIGSYKLPSVPNWIFKHFLEVMFDNRNEKKELLEALVIPDEDFTVPYYSKKFGLLWGQNDKIFNMENASNLKKQLGDKAKMFESIEKAGHLVPIERPCVYNTHLKKVLVSLSKDT